MAVTVAQVKKVVKEACGATNAKIQCAIDRADACINRTQWGANRADEATLWLSGHFFITLGLGNNADPGARTSEREGAVATSYAVNPDAMKSIYGTTVYGRQYLELRRTAFPDRFG